MAELSTDLAYDFPPFIRVYKDGRVERLVGTATVPPSVHPISGVQSKDVTVAANPRIGARLYLPRITPPGNAEHGRPSQKLPLLLYFHGGAFCVESPYSPTYQNYLDTLVAEARVVAVSVEYRRAPEHPLPTAFEDCWTALEWVAAQSEGGEAWIREHADMGRVFLAGDSAGGNIAHNMALRIGLAETPIGFHLQGLVLVHPYFWGEEAIGKEEKIPDSENRSVAGRLWRLVCPASSGCDDPLINPGKEEKLKRVGCERVLVAVAEKDGLCERGWYYGEVLRKSGWSGTAEVVETKGEGHVFHLFRPDGDKAVELLKRVAAFLNH